MKKLTTIVCCTLLTAFGAIVGLNNKHPASTASAAPPTITLPLDLQLPRIKYDTVYVTRDTVIPCKKRHYPTKRKEVRIPYAVTDTLYVPVTTTIILKDRKESSLDSTECIITHEINTLIQKPSEIPDSAVVQPVDYISYGSH